MFILLLLVLFICSIVFVLRQKDENSILKEQNNKLEIRYNDFYNKYSKIIDIDDEVKKYNDELSKITKKIDEMEKLFQATSTEYQNLLKAQKLLEEDIESLECGLYKPHFNFDSSERYKIAMVNNYDEQKELIKKNKAVNFNENWTVDGSKSKGLQMTKRNCKLMLRAFNGECDSIIAKVSWNNMDKMEARMQKAFNDINKMGETNLISIDNKYLSLKFQELYLAHEYENKKQEEKEEQARIREQIREEERAQKEFEKAQKEAEKEEEHYEKALAQARIEMENAKGEEINIYKNKLDLLEQQLKEVQEKKERALSQAQLTKAGHIYVISNIGSFGEDIYKIGMTRRLEPLDRVRELGDASVPFRFDVHALIYSENAPELENKLHNIFRDKSVNLVNYKKEFFNVSLDEIKKAVEQNYGEIEFTKLAEAKEYRESVAIKKAMLISSL